MKEYMYTFKYVNSPTFGGLGLVVDMLINLKRKAA
jgi:hypothetical protein